jgi:hypothetical protein
MFNVMRTGLIAGGFLFAGVCLCWCRAADLAPWAGHADPADVAKQHVEEITAGQHAYTVTQGGAMDGENCRSPLGCGMSREGVCEQVWESNRSLRMENVGETDLVNPWVSNGRNTFRSISEMVATAVTPGMSDREKAFALWFQEIRHRYHFNGSVDNKELCDPVKVFNIYGFNTCGNDSICLADLWRKAGLKVAPARAVGHCISQVFYDGGWHFLDGDLHAAYLLRDNETVAGEQDLVRDHDLVKRGHTQGILFADSHAQEEGIASLYFCDNPVNGDRGGACDTTLNMTLRPGEALVWRWGHLTPPKCQGNSRLNYPDMVCNGLWEYRPDFARPNWQKGAEHVEGVKAGADGLSAEDGKSGTIVWIMRSPYVFVGGRLETEGTGAKFDVSFDGKTWAEVKESMDSLFAVKSPGRYQYRLRCQLSADARLKRLTVVNDVQMAPCALPGMVVGANAFTYTDQSQGDRKVRLTHQWVERSSSKLPEAPSDPLAPANGGEYAGTDVVFQWPPAKSADNSKIADYHFELSNRQDMKWPLSSFFYKLISRTADQGKAQYALPAPGLLSPGKVYYWHVRAKNEKGVWGPWSKTWSFTPKGPAYPVDLTVAYDAGKNEGVLRWKANPAGSKPARYRVYGSDEKGFTVSDAAYPVAGGAAQKLPASFPANFIAEVSATELAVNGAGVALPAANKTYYRVVAVDDQGKRSGPSEYATAPRPILYGTPMPHAKVGALYHYQIAANRSLGDVQQNVKSAVGFWMMEKPAFTLTGGPAWLMIDEQTGLLSGTPDAATGKFEFTVSATLAKPVQKINDGALKWGTLKIDGESTETLGPATQKFTLVVDE